MLSVGLFTCGWVRSGSPAAIEKLSFLSGGAHDLEVRHGYRGQSGTCVPPPGARIVERPQREDVALSDLRDDEDDVFA